MNKDTGKRVKCHACNKPIHIDDFGAVVGDGKGKQKWFHDNIVCLITYVEEQKSNAIKGTKD